MNFINDSEIQNCSKSMNANECDDVFTNALWHFINSIDIQNLFIKTRRQKFPFL